VPAGVAVGDSVEIKDFTGHLVFQGTWRKTETAPRRMRKFLISLEPRSAALCGLSGSRAIQKNRRRWESRNPKAQELVTLPR
jgi:hypothetical protein